MAADDGGKLKLAIIIIGFWLFVPIPFMLLNQVGIPVLNPNDYIKLLNIKAGVVPTGLINGIPFIGGILTFLGTLINVCINLGTVYFDILILNFPGSNIYPIIQYITWFLQFISIILVFLMLWRN